MTWSQIVPERSVIEVEGVVVELLPRALCRVRIAGEREVTAHLGSGTGKNFVRVLVGDRVVIELTENDVTRGRIVKVVGGGRR